MHDSGLVYLWEMDGSAIAASGSPGAVGPEWHVRGTGDFDGDGKSDILWQNDDGLVYLWEMNGSTISGSGSPGAVGPEWQVQPESGPITAPVAAPPAALKVFRFSDISAPNDSTMSASSGVIRQPEALSTSVGSCLPPQPIDPALHLGAGHQL